MPDPATGGVWLLLDASGPVTVAGLVSGGRWLARNFHEGEFLEWFQGAVAGLLREDDLRLEDLDGVIYGAGPGSTLGLRLAAMFIRSLGALPSLEHWSCHQYQDLELALAGSLADTGSVLREAAAPWRRDRLHHCRLTGTHPLTFGNGHIAPAEAARRQLPGFILGRRPANMPPGIEWQSPPLDRIPEILSRYPELLTPAAAPAPYQAESPDFVRWTAGRHTGK